MQPEFALTLSFEGISLLHRVPGGWTPVGDVALDAADLRAALADLRTEADTLSDTGGQVKLVLPNEQIKYLAIPDTGLQGDVLEAEIKDALDGATPYAVSELSFDWVKSNGSILIAAVANETLDEAEAFAKSHHFDPVCFVANAPEGQFSGEVFFGAAASWHGDTPAKDDAALKIVDAPVAGTPNAESPQPNSTRPEIDPSMADLVEDPAEALNEAQVDEDNALAPGAASDHEADSTDEDDGQIPAAPAPSVAPPTATPTPSFASIRASRAAPAPAENAPAIPTPNATPGTDVKPRFKLGGARKSTADSDVTAPALQVEASEPTPDRKGVGFFSRRKPKPPEAPPTPPAAEKTPKPEPALSSQPKHDPGPARAAVARIAAMRAGREPDVAPTSDTAALSDERERMTIFGARTEPEVGGKPRLLGLMLTSALLIFLLAVAAWASVFLDEGISRFFDRTDETPSIARLPDVELTPIDGSITEPPKDEEVQVAALDVGDENAVADDGLSDLLPPPATLTPEEADARYAATGIWQRAPASPTPPRLTTLDDLYIASIDSRIEQFDALALPTAQALRNDEVYLSQPNPPLPGTRYDLNDRGLVIATPEGTVNPEGVRVFAGLPPVVPPQRPDAPEVQPSQDAENAVVAPEEASLALQQFRPRPRPDGLVEGNERAQLGGFTRAELAAFRPSLRPDALKTQEEESQPEATQFAVAQSVEPVTRPRDFSRVVARAQELREQQTQATQVAAVAPRVVQPRIPSTANVARQATVRNAINLRRINLIGVYGKPSNRRALVRLSSGRYQKVKVGDRLDGGRVAAIGNTELRYTKNGRNVVLDMPDG